VKERRVAGRVGDLAVDSDEDRRREDRRRALLESDPSGNSDLKSEEADRVRRLLESADDWTDALKHRRQPPCKVTRVEREIALAERPAAMSPEAALAYSDWMLASDRGWHSTPGEHQGPSATVDEPLGSLASAFAYLIPGEHRQARAAQDPQRSDGVRSMSERVPLARSAAPASPSPLDQLAARRNANHAQDERSATTTAATVTRAVPQSRLAARELPGHHAGLSREQSETQLEEVLTLVGNAGSGAPLPESVAARMEAELGHSFAHVRVHLDAVAAEACAQLGAQAFTLGNHIYFGAGQFAPDSDDGAGLLRHELTHVVQHARGELASRGRAELVAPSSAAEIEARAAEAPKPRPRRAMPAWAGGAPEGEAHELTHVAQELRGRSTPAHDGLQVSQPDDPAEREADTFADRVDQLAREQSPIDVTTGEPLPADVRARFESSFGADLGHVRVHRGGHAESWVASIGANAATTSNHIAFGAGQFAPSTPDGDRLIGHELAHVLQHANGQVAPGMTTPGDAAETEAANAGGRAAAGLPAGPIRAPAAAVARDVSGKKTELIEFEVDPENRNQLVHEPKPEVNALWIDNSLTQVGYTIWLFGFDVWVKGQPDPIIIPEDHIRFTVDKAIPINHHIYNSYAEAVAAVAKTAVPAADKTPRYAYYWGAGGMVVAPTLICPATAPRTTETMWQTRVKYAEYVQLELVGLAEMMILGKLLGLAHQRAGRVGNGETPAPPKLGKTEPAKTEPVKTEPVKTEPVEAKPGKGASVKGEPVKGEPVKTRPVKIEPVKGEATKSEPAKTTQVSGETDATRVGKQVHKANADARRQSGEWDDVNTPMKTKDGKAVEVPKRVNLKTGEPAGTETQAAQPDAVSYKRGEILDDKPAGRPISKDRQEMLRNIEAYRQRTGELPKKIIVERYDPATGKHVGTETYSPSDFLPQQPGAQ
jgi:Domain of unknown function (DUF4157)